MKEVGGVSGFGGPFGGLNGGKTCSVYMTDNMDGAVRYRSNVWNNWRHEVKMIEGGIWKDRLAIQPEVKIQINFYGCHTMLNNGAMRILAWELMEADTILQMVVVTNE